MTSAARQQRKRDRDKAGLVRIEAWVPSYAKEAVEAAIIIAAGDARAAQLQTPRQPNDPLARMTKGSEK